MADASLTIAGELVLLRPERAVWWPARRTLLVADLHLGKEAFFAAHGIPMPRAILDETLLRLDGLVAACGAERIVVVGDLMHATAGLTAAVRERVATWRRSRPVRFELVEGNHDRAAALPGEWGVHRRDEGERDGPFLYRHDPASLVERSAAGEGFTWCGHLHPTVRLADGVDRIVLPCFEIGGRRGLLPAFTAFSRGVAVEPGPDARVYAIAGERVVELPAPRDRRQPIAWRRSQRT